MDETFTKLDEVVNQVAVEEVEEITTLDADDIIFYHSISAELNQLQRNAPQPAIDAILSFSRSKG